MLEAEGDAGVDVELEIGVDEPVNVDLGVFD